MARKYFFGWNNLKWLVKEIRNIYSDTDKSIFSKKRFESSVAFFVGQWGMVYFIIHRIGVMTTSEIISWSAVEFVMAGYTVSQIQKEKKKEDNAKEKEDENTQQDIGR